MFTAAADLVGATTAHAGPDQLPEDAIHRVAIGDPQRVRHQLLADFRIGMVDGKSVRLKSYSRGCGRLGPFGCGGRRLHREVGSGVHVEFSLGHALEARAVRHAPAIIRRGDPVQFQLWVRISGRNRKPAHLLLRGDGKLQRFGILE